MTVALGLLLTTQHALATPTETDEISTSVSGMISRTELAAIERIDVNADSFSRALGLSLETRLFLFEHYGAGRVNGGPLHYPPGVESWTNWDDSNTALDSYTITRTDHLAVSYGDGEDG
ncbi:MAG: hypothetical protein ACRDTG_16760 [Pseudonocardiaceae bacterium]